jgi:hypothetical protein
MNTTRYANNFATAGRVEVPETSDSEMLACYIANARRMADFRAQFGDNWSKAFVASLVNQGVSEVEAVRISNEVRQ